MDSRVIFNYAPKTKKVKSKTLIVPAKVTKSSYVQQRDAYKKVVISPFEVKDFYEDCPSYDFSLTSRDYCFINTKELYPIVHNLTTEQTRFLWQIFHLCEPNSNIVFYNVARQFEIYGTCRNTHIYDILPYLEEQKLSKRANLKSSYIINHNLFFKGNLNQFSIIYHRLYDGVEIKYNKQGDVIVNEKYNQFVVKG